MSQVDPLSESQELTGSGNGSSSHALAKIDNQLHPVPAVGWGFGPPQRPEILSAKPNPAELMHAVRRRLPLTLGLGVAAAILAAGLVWFFLPVKYEAYALLRVAESEAGVLEKGGQGREAFEIFKRTQVQMMLSGPVMRGTVREPAIQKLSMIRENNDDPAAWLKKQLILDYPDDAEVLRVAMKGTVPAETMKIVDAVVKKYLTEVVHAAREKNLQQGEKIEKQYQDFMTQFTRESEALHTLQQVNKDSATQAAQVANRLAEEDLLEALVQRNNILRAIYQNDLDKTILEARKAEPDSARIPDAVVEMELKRDPIVLSLTERKADIQASLARHMTVTVNPLDSTHVRQLNAMINEIDQQIDEHKANMRPHVIEMLNAKDMMDNNPTSGTMTVAMYDKQREHLEKALEEAEAHIEKETAKFDSIEKYSGNVMAKKKELAALEQIMTELKADLDRTEVERLAMDRIEKIDDAQLDSTRGDSIRKYVATLFSGFLAFCLVVVGIAFFEFQSRKLVATPQVNDGLGIKVIGELPSVSGRKWRRIRGGKGPAVLKALMAERIDGTRTALIHASASQPPRVVMVTSADPHEGKTTTSSQLAASLARAGRRTLLIDADIRNPGVHRVFDMPLEPGLAELLRGEAERDAVVHPTRTANLWLLPAGRCDLRSVQALSTSYLGTAIAGLCVQFDYVVIDSGPVLKVADSLLVGQHVDAAILSVLKDHSKVPHVYEACERLRSVGITVLGAVVNGVNDDAARHGVELLMSETT
ncbi:MAG: polysaccharide biosynthesis tyrosine autokinase [Pirellulales bacterium]